MTTAIPTEASELEALLSDTDKLGDLFNEGKFGDFVKAYAGTVIKKDADLGAQVKEQTQLALAEMLHEKPSDSGVKRLNMALRSQGHGGAGNWGARNALYNAKAPGAAIDLYEDTSEFFQAIWHRSSTLPNGRDLANKRDKAQEIQNAYSSTVPAEGGFLIPEEMRSELLSIALETAVVRPRARVIPMSTLRTSLPMVDSTSNASSVFGGVICYWVEESAQLTTSSANFGRVVLDAKKLTGYAEIPNELVADAVGFQAFFNQTFPQAIAWYEDDAFILGDGAGMPLGVFNSPAVVAVAAESGQTPGTIVWENIVKMYSRMLPSSMGSAVWVAHIDTFPELATMALSVGTGGSAIWLNNGTQGPPMTILGRPVIFTEKAQSVGTQGDISFIDFGYYLIGDRQVMQVESSAHYKFQNDLTAFRVIERLDGRPWIQNAITPKRGSNTLTPFVQLATR